MKCRWPNFSIRMCAWMYFVLLLCFHSNVQFNIYIYNKRNISDRNRLHIYTWAIQLYSIVIKNSMKSSIGQKKKKISKKKITFYLFILFLCCVCDCVLFSFHSIHWMFPQMITQSKWTENVLQRDIFNYAVQIYGDSLHEIKQFHYNRKIYECWYLIVSMISLIMTYRIPSTLKPTKYIKELFCKLLSEQTYQMNNVGIVCNAKTKKAPRWADTTI